MQTLLWVPNYSCYSDQATLPVTIMMILLCILMHKLCMMCGKCCKIWKIDEVIEKVADGADAGDDFLYIINKIHLMTKEDERIVVEETPASLRFNSKVWFMIEKQRIRDQ